MSVDIKSVLWTPTGRVMWSRFFPPRKSDEEDSEDFWCECTLICPADAPEWKKLNRVFDLIIKEKFKGKKPANFKMPWKTIIHDGEPTSKQLLIDPDDKNYDGYEEGMIAFPVRSKNRIVVPHKMVGEDDDGKAILEKCTKEDFYSGCYARAKVKLFEYDNKSKGTSAGLSNIFFVKHGKPIGGGARKAEDDFEDADKSIFNVDNSDKFDDDEDDDYEY